MKAFCTSCGTALNADTALCTGCGAPAASTVESKRKNRKWPWVLALIAVFSAMSYDVNGRTDQYGSSSGIVTASAFDDVVEWYRKSLPPGWSNSTISDLNRLGAIAQQLSPDKIMQVLAAPNGVIPVKSGGEIPATAAADRMRLSLF